SGLSGGTGVTRCGGVPGIPAGSVFLLTCSANASHALAIASSDRLLSRSLDLWASARHFSAFDRYQSVRSVMPPVPGCQRHWACLWDLSAWGEPPTTKPPLFST